MDRHDADIEREALDAIEDALEQPSDERDNYVRHLRTLSEPAKARAMELLDAESSTAGGLMTGGAANCDEEDEDPDFIGGYRVLRLIGRGGMGNVYLAERATDDFDLIVAIKLIKRRLITNEMLDRFRRERQILADLNHPNIARLFDGGETDDGVPYFVMEYVDGLPLDRWLKHAEPSLDTGLAVFERICSAVEAAHQRLVIHRDLTPPNVLIADGETVKLIDFGIARPDDEDDGFSQRSAWTPGFAAPEQKAGEDATTLSDVYGLGKLLALLIGDDAPDDLKAISNKAAAVETNARYSSVSALVEDVRNYCELRPVSAMDAGPLYGVRKFVRRQRLATAAVAIVSVAILTTLVLVTQAYRETELARAQAEASLTDTRELAGTMMFDVYDEVGRISGSTKARALLARTAQKYLDSLASDPDAPIDVKIDAALGYLRLGQVVGGDLRGNTLGDLSQGQSFFARAKVMLRELHEQYPDRENVKSAYGQALTVAAGERLLVESDIENGLSDATRAINLLEGVEDKDDKVAAALILAYRFQADAFSRVPKVEETEASLKTGMAKAERYSKAMPRSIEIMRADAELRQSYAGFLYYFAQEGEEAERMFEQSVALRREVAKLTNEAPDDRYKLLVGLYYLALTESALYRDEEAFEHANEAYTLAQNERLINPDSRSQESLLAGMQMLYGQTLSKKGRHSEAVTLARKSIALMRKRYEQNPDVGAGSMHLAVRLHESAGIFSAADLSGESCDAMQESVKYMEDFDRRSGLPAVNRSENLEPMREALKACQ